MPTSFSNECSLQMHELTDGVKSFLFIIELHTFYPYSP